MAAQRIDSKVAECVASHYLSEHPSIASMCDRWQLSRPTVKAIIDGQHPSLSAMMKRKLGKPRMAMVDRSGGMSKSKNDVGSLKLELKNLLDQTSMLKKMVTSLARQHA